MNGTDFVVDGGMTKVGCFEQLPMAFVTEGVLY